MASLNGKIVGKLIISSDTVATAKEVEQYVTDSSKTLSDDVMTNVQGVVNNVRNDLLDKINDIAVDGFVPLSALSSEVLKIISANYQTVVDYLDGKQDDQIVVGGGTSVK